jgi:Bacterial regulatory proteins, gntR family
VGAADRERGRGRSIWRSLTPWPRISCLAGLAPGMRLPPQRTLADSLDIDFTTVTRAYTQARKFGSAT